MFGLTDDLIGQTIHLKKDVYTLNGHVIVQWDVNDSTMDTTLKNMFPDGVRVHLPGQVFTMDYKPGRANISVTVNEEAETAVIKSITFG